MAEELDPAINMLLTKYPLFFKLADRARGQKHISSTEASIAQPQTSQEVVANRMDRKGLENAMNAEADHVEQNINDVLLLTDFNSFKFDHGSDIEATTPNRSKDDKLGPGQTTLVKLADEYENSPEKEERQTLSEWLLESPASCGKSPAERSISPPLRHALACRDSILNYQKPEISPLRNEIYNAPADEDGLAPRKGQESLLGSPFLHQPFVLRGRVIDLKDMSWLGIHADAAKFKSPTAGAHSCTKAEADKEGATKEKTAQEGSKQTRWTSTTLVKRDIVDEDSPVPPSIAVSKDTHGYTKLTLNLPAPTLRKDQATEWSFRESGIKLHVEEQIKVANKFDYDDQVACSTILDDNQVDEADKLLDWINKLLATLAEHSVDSGDISPPGTKTSIATSLEMPAEVSRIQNLIDVIRETSASLADPSYNITTARERFALSKGVKFDSHLAQRIYNLIAEIGEELHKPHSSFEMATDHEERRILMLEKMAMLEMKAFGESKSEESKLAIEGPVTIRVKDKKSDVHVGGSTISQGQQNGAGKGKGKKSKQALVDVVNAKGKGKECDMLVEGSNIGSGKGNQSELLMEGPKKKKRRAKSKKIKSPKGSAVTGKGKSKEGDTLVEASTSDKGKGKECELLMEGPATEKGITKENDLPRAQGKVKGKNKNDLEAKIFHYDVDLLREAGAVFLGPKPNSFIITSDSGSTASIDPKVIKARDEALMAFKKMHDVMELVIRPQTASPYQLDIFCRVVEDPEYFSVMKSVVEELRWNRAVVQHPYNSMITSILQRTAHLRPTDGLHHSSGISVAPVLLHQHLPRPPGLEPATPAVTTPTKEQHTKGGPGNSGSKRTAIKLKRAFEDPLKVLDQREAVLMAKMKTKLGKEFGEVFDNLTTIVNNKRKLKEKARLEEAGGKIADRLAQRLKKLAEEDGVPTYLLP